MKQLINTSKLRKALKRFWNTHFVMQRNYHPLRVIFYLHIERQHRLVFDNLYRQDYRIKLKDKPLLIYYKCLCRIAPKFRAYLKYWKPIITRAYNQKRVNYSTLCSYWKLKQVNTERYAPYFD